LCAYINNVIATLPYLRYSVSQEGLLLPYPSGFGRVMCNRSWVKLSES